MNGRDKNTLTESNLNYQPVIVLISIILLFAITFSMLALNRHAAFQTNGFDLGNVNQAVWNTAHGNLLAFTNMAPLQNRLALHVEPILLLLAPFYWLGLGSPQFLLVVQAISFAVGAWPLYLLTRAWLGNWVALGLSFAYLLYPPLQAAVLYDFHAVTLAPPFFLFALYFLEKWLTDSESQTMPSQGEIGLLSFMRQPAFIFLVLALACKEDMGLVVALLGLVVGFYYKTWRLALILFLFGLSWSFIAIVFIQPQFAVGGNVQGDRYDWLFSAWQQPQLIWEHLWVKVNTPLYLWRLFAPVAGLALLSPISLFPILPSLAINLLSDHPLTWRPEEFHYVAPMAPFIFVATAKGLQRGQRWLTRIAFFQRIRGERQEFTSNLFLLIILLTATLTYHYYRGFSPLARPFRWYVVDDHQQLGANLATQISPDVPLFAPLSLNPHVSSRPVLHQDFEDITPVDWLWLDVATLPNQNNIQTYIRDTLVPNYTWLEANDGFLYLKPQPSTMPLPSSFFTFTERPLDFQPIYKTAIMFNQSLVLRGYELHLNRAEEILVTTYWQNLAPLPAELTPVLFLADEAGNLVGATTALEASPTLVWRPANLWSMDKLMVVSFKHVNWYTRNRQAYRLALGVTTNPDPWQVEARWQPTNIPTTQTTQTTEADNRVTPYLLADRTVVELARFEQVAGLPQGAPVWPQFDSPVMSQRLQTTFGNQIELWGYNHPRYYQTEGGTILELDLLWRGVVPSMAEYVRFVHLVGGGKLQGQNDSAPVGDTYPTSLWTEGKFVVETVQIPLPQAVELDGLKAHIGFYNPISGERLINEAGQDYVEIDVTP